MLARDQPFLSTRSEKNLHALVTSWDLMMICVIDLPMKFQSPNCFEKPRGL